MSCVRVGRPSGTGESGSIVGIMSREMVGIVRAALVGSSEWDGRMCGISGRHSVPGDSTMSVDRSSRIAKRCRLFGPSLRRATKKVSKVTNLRSRNTDDLDSNAD